VGILYFRVVEVLEGLKSARKSILPRCFFVQTTETSGLSDGLFRGLPHLPMSLRGRTSRLASAFVLLLSSSLSTGAAFGVNAIGGLGGALASGNAEGVAIGGTAGGNAAEHNYLRHAEAMRLGELQDLKLRGRCDATCERGIAELETLDKQRNSALAACEGQSSSHCQTLRQDVRVAAADYIRATEVQLDLRYGQERDEALALARQSMGGMTLSDMAGGYAQATQEGLDALWQGAKTAAQALMGDPQAQAELREGAGQFWDTVQDPQNWPYLLGAMTPQQREELAQAYERGDIKTAGRLTGEQVANLPSGGGMGSIKKVGVLPKPGASPIDIAHTIGADYNPKTGKVTGGHTVVNGDVRVTEIVSGPDANGVYEAIVEIQTPDGSWQTKTAGASSKPQKNTMFPKDWDAQRVQAEIESAWASQRPHPEDKNKWIGTSDSGIQIEGYRQPRTTAYPLREERKP